MARARPLDKASPLANRAAFRAECVRLLVLAWPVVLTHMNWSLMSVIDVIFVGQVGTFELGALGAARSVNWIFIVMGMSALTGVLVFTAQADGAGDLPKTGVIFRQGIILSLIISALGLVFMLILPGTLMRTLGVAVNLRAPGVEVVTAYAMGFPSLLVLSAASYFLEGISRPQRVMAVNLAILPLNILLDWIMAMGGLGFPVWGAYGAAAATSISMTVGAILILWSCSRLPRAASRDLLVRDATSWREAWVGLGRLAHFGIMPAISAGLELAGFTYLLVLATRLGLIPTAAIQVIMSLHTLTFALALGLASAAGVRVGNAVGAGEQHLALPRTLLASLLAVLVMLGPVLLFLFVPGLIVGGFSNDEKVVALGTQMLFLLAPFIFFDGLQAVGVSALRSLEDQVVAGVNSVIAFLLVIVAVALWSLSRGSGPLAIIHAMQAGMLAACLLQFGRLCWLSRRWC